MRKTFLFPSNNGQNLAFSNSFVSKRTRFALVYWEAVPTRSECTTMREVMFTFDMSISLLKCTCEIDTFSYIFLFINFINTANVAVLVFLLNVNYLFFTMLYSLLRYLRYDTSLRNIGFTFRSLCLSSSARINIHGGALKVLSGSLFQKQIGTSKSS